MASSVTAAATGDRTLGPGDPGTGQRITQDHVGAENTHVGSGALASVTSGQGNSAVGSNALRSLTTGFRNGALGENALRDLTTGPLQQRVRRHEPGEADDWAQQLRPGHGGHGSSDRCLVQRGDRWQRPARERVGNQHGRHRLVGAPREPGHREHRHRRQCAAPERERLEHRASTLAPFPAPARIGRVLAPSVSKAS